MWNQVGSPSMFDGKTFLPLHGMPMWCRARSRTRLADWLPEPLTVPTRMARSLTEEGDDGSPLRAGYVSTTERVDDMERLKMKGIAARFPRAFGVVRLTHAETEVGKEGGTVH